MATDYGTDIAALTDLPDPEVLISGPLVVAYSVARRWLTRSGALAEIGDETPYASFDLRDYLGARGIPGIEQTLQAKCIACGSEDVRVSSLTVTVTLAAGRISVDALLQLADGPFAFVLSVDAVTATLLQG